MYKIIQNIISFESKQKKQIKLIIFLFPLIALIFFVSMKYISAEFYDNFVDEDNFIEYFQFLLYFTSFLITLAISINFFKKNQRLTGLIYIIFTLGLFYVAMEEISWGQRIFQFQTSSFFLQNNYQGEMNFHNLEGTQYLYGILFGLIGLYGSFFWLIMPKKLKNSFDTYYFVPQWFLIFYFFPILFRKLYFDVIRESFLGTKVNLFQLEFLAVWKEQEPTELMLALGFFLFVLYNIYRLNISKQS